MTETQTTETKEILNEYFWSTDERPFEPVWVHFEINDNSYPLVKDAPDPSLKSPKYDWRNGIWNDNLADSLNTRMTKTTEAVKNLTETVNQIQANSQAQQKQATENDSKTNKSVQALQQIVMSMSQSVAQQSAILTNLADKLETTKSAVTTPTTQTGSQAVSTDATTVAKTEPQAVTGTKEEGAE
uniref:hypothetical protein n=1 Tax=Lactobacillus acidophilus TaxID=1579 RepID=UPI003F563961